MWCLEFVIFYGSVLYKLNKLSQKDLEKTVKAFAILHYYDNEVALASKQFFICEGSWINSVKH